MASIRKEIPLAVAPGTAWTALRDFGGAHRAFPGVLVGSRLDGDVRTVTFADGTVVRERLVTVDDRQRRLVYTVIEGATTHHNASFEVVADAEGRCRVIWISDFLPDSIEPMIRALVDQGAQALRSTLEAGR
jgi:carbon monoxide dehydrogenase subunit G